MAPEGAAICDNCDEILDSSFLGDEEVTPVEGDKTDVGSAPPKAEDAPDDWHTLPPATASGTIRWSKLVTDWHMILLCLQQFMRAGAMAKCAPA